MGNIPEEVLLYRIKQETAAREAAIAALLAALDTATAESQQKIIAVASKLTATIGGRSVNSSAIAGVILTSQVAPGFAYASQLTLLEAKVTSDALYSLARITELREVTATEFEAKAQQILTIQATFNASKAKFTEDILANANATSAVTSRTTTLEATVNNPTSGVVASSARITAEETTRATADTATANRTTTLESTVNNPTTGVAAAIARITSEENTRSTADTAISSSVTTLTSTVNGQSANITTLQNTTSTLSSSISTLQTTVGSQGVSITTAQTAANTAQNAANAAQTTANDKIKTFIQGTTPTAVAVGDLWIDTANNNRIKRWSGSAWVDASDVRITTMSSSIDTIATANTTRDSTVANLTTTVSAQSTAISNAQGTANTASAAVTTEANARANADGTLSARASLLLDVNGHIAGFKIGADVNLAGGTTSDFTITADTFKIVNGGVNTSPFSVSGGVVYMTNAKVSSSLDIGSGSNQVRIVGSGIQVGSGAGQISMEGVSSQMLIRIGGSLSFAELGGGLGGAYLSLGNGGSPNVSLSDSGTGNFTGSLTVNGNTYSGSFSSNGNGSFNSLNISASATVDSLNVNSSASINGAGFSNTTVNLHPGSNNNMTGGEDGGTNGANTGAYISIKYNGRQVWIPFFTALP